MGRADSNLEKQLLPALGVVCWRVSWITNKHTFDLFVMGVMVAFSKEPGGRAVLRRLVGVTAPHPAQTPTRAKVPSLELDTSSD